ncbi:hypothetical protein Ae263Ps1_1353 [Pseudonocardia sp. Ae263_Ps1]|nr:hypothetical protein Ae263Ps1_1353 [Pseudonocardia sp. Ae263_Ps1]
MSRPDRRRRPALTVGCRTRPQAGDTHGFLQVHREEWRAEAAVTGRQSSEHPGNDECRTRSPGPAC